ncbi:hypothetical protein AGMMS50239_36730 [Bacteroidia bacterium]|nr:hypothetical protein AGMMS50239_36730 [Bacteroidia bacterium]
MNRLEGYINFLRAINKFDAVDRPTTSESEVWLNRGQDKFVKTRYSGNNAKMEGFEQSQKRIEDLRTLLMTSDVTLTKTGQKQAGTIPEGLMIFIGDTCMVVPSVDVNNTDGSKIAECWETAVDDNGNKYWVPKLTEVTDVTQDTIHGNLTSSLAPHNFMYGQARPLRLFIGNKVEIYSDGSYMANTYQMTYLKHPAKISLYTPRADSLCELPVHTHPEIVQIAADLYLAATAGPTVQIQTQIEPTIE